MLKKRNSKGKMISCCKVCYEELEKITSATYGYVENGKNIRLYCSKHGKEKKMISLKTDNRNKHKVESNRDGDNGFYNIFNEKKFKLEMNLFSQHEEEEVSLDDEIELQIVNCEFQPILCTLKNGIWSVRYWNLNNLRKITKKFNNHNDALIFYNQRNEEFKDMELSTFKLSIRYLIEHDITYFYRFFRIPLWNPMEYDEADLPIEPYYFGLWLGDGKSTKQYISTEDPEVVDYLEEYAERLEMKVSKTNQKGNCADYLITDSNSQTKNYLLENLRKLNLIKNKHIPDVYFKSSVQQRKELLAGILDSDGSKTSSQSFEFSQCIERKTLFENVVKLCKELGFYTKSGYRFTKPFKESSKKFESGRLKIVGNFYDVPTRIARKKCNKDTKTSKSDVFIWELKFVDGSPLQICPLRNQSITSMNEKLQKLYDHYIENKTLSLLGTNLSQFKGRVSKLCGKKLTFDMIKNSECSIVRLLYICKSENQ